MPDKEQLNEVIWNLRWLAWKRNPNPANWAAELRAMSRGFVSWSRALGLLSGSDPSREEADAIASVAGLEREELLGVPLYARESSVLHENLGYLVASLPQGEQKAAAVFIGISASQLSRWQKMKGRPRKANIRKLLRFHGMDPDTDLEKDPLFLSMEPLSGYAQKAWVAGRVQDMPASEIATIYPALKKLLRDDAKD